MVRPAVVLPVPGLATEFDRGTFTVVPSAPTLSITPGDAQNTLSWTTVSNATGYQIYWDTTATITLSDNKIIVPGDGDTDEYIHTGLTNGTTYYYAIVAVGAWGLTALSNEVSGEPNALSLSTLFDGVDQYVDFGDVHKYDISQAFSISMWVKPQNISAARILFSKAGPGPAVDGYMLRHDATTGALFLQMRSGTDRSHTFDKSLTASVWQHVVFTYAGGSNINGAHVYLDASKSSTPSSGSLSGTMLVGADFFLGQRNGSFYFSGNMDEVTVWDKELTQSEVTELYNSGSPEDPTGHSAAANLQSWYKMGDGDTAPTISDNVGSDDGTMINDPTFENDSP